MPGLHVPVPDIRLGVPNDNPAVDTARFWFCVSL